MLKASFETTIKIGNPKELTLEHLTRPGLSAAFTANHHDGTPPPASCVSSSTARNEHQKGVVKWVLERS